MFISTIGEEVDTASHCVILGFNMAHRDFVWVRQFFLGGYRVQICACIVARCYPFFMRAVKAAALYMGAPGTMFSKDGLDKANMDPNPT